MFSDSHTIIFFVYEFLCSYPKKVNRAGGAGETVSTAQLRALLTEVSLFVDVKAAFLFGKAMINYRCTQILTVLSSNWRTSSCVNCEPDAVMNVTWSVF